MFRDVKPDPEGPEVLQAARLPARPSKKVKTEAERPEELETTISKFLEARVRREEKELELRERELAIREKELELELQKFTQK